MATKKFKCTVCGYIHEGKAAPETCPVCAAPASAFVEIEDAKKKGMLSDKNGNAYIIMYSTVMVVIVATLLAVAALSLQKRQYANELNEKKSSILSSLSAQDQDYDTFIDAYVVDARGEKVEGQDVFELLKDLQGAFDDGKFPVLLAAAHDILRAVLRYLVRRGELFRPRSCALSGRGGIRRFGAVRHQPHALELFRCGAYLTHRAAEVARGGVKVVPAAPRHVDIQQRDVPVVRGNELVRDGGGY